MNTILGSPYIPPTPEELEAMVRQAHRERSQAMRDLFSGLFKRRETRAEPPTAYASPRPSL